MKYECYEIEFQKGYNRGDAHFLELEKGYYIIRLKTETSTMQTRYVLNFTTNKPITIREVGLPHAERSLLMREAMISIGDRVKSSYLSSRSKTEKITFGNEFLTIGYGFIMIESEKSSKKDTLMEVNPEYISYDVGNFEKQATPSRTSSRTSRRSSASR